MKTIRLELHGEHRITETIFIRSLDVVMVGEEDTVLVPEPNVISFQGVGNQNIYCKECGAVLAREIGINQISTLSIRCPKCGLKAEF